MILPYKVATLLYCFNERDEVLLLERAQEPNRGLWSPCGGKLKTDIGESPYACACREAEEELGIKIHATDLHLTGLKALGAAIDIEAGYVLAKAPADRSLAPAPDGVRRAMMVSASN